MPKKKKVIPSIGDKFYRFTFLGYSHSDKYGRRCYKVKCDCGTETVKSGSAIVSGNTKSCGCLASDSAQKKRKPNNHTEVTAIILGYKRHAMDRGLRWVLSRKYINEIIRSNCHYCGRTPSNKKVTKNSIDGGLLYSGIDRMDSSKGYTRSNTVPCCKMCNYAKSNYSVGEFRDWVKRLSKMIQEKKW